MSFYAICGFVTFITLTLVDLMEAGGDSRQTSALLDLVGASILWPITWYMIATRRMTLSQLIEKSKLPPKDGRK